jgi:hypothetical protein
MDLKIQFLLFSDTNSKLGLNIVYGLRKLGTKTEFFWPKTNIGSLLEKPDYVFCFEPENDNLAVFFKKKGAKNCLIVSSKVLSRERQMVYNFAVAHSVELLGLYDLPTYLIKEEFDSEQVETENSAKSFLRAIKLFEKSKLGIFILDRGE